MRRIKLGSADCVSALASIAIYCTFAVLLYGAMNPLSADHLPSGGNADPAQMAWFLAWTPFALFHGHSLLNTNFLDFPTGINLADNTSAPALGLLSSPITHFLGPIASLNLLFRLAFASSATVMYFLLRSFKTSVPASFLGGLLYGFGPYLISQGQANAHLNLAFVPLLPALVWSAHELVFRRRCNSIAIGALVGFIGALQFLIAPELLSDTVLISIPFVAGIAIAGHATLRREFAFFFKSSASAVVLFVVFAGYSVLNLVLGKGHVVGSVQPTPHLQSFSSDLLSPIVPNARQLIAPESMVTTAMHFVARNPSEQGGYLGVTLIAVALICVIWQRRDRFMQSAAVLALIAFVASLGAHLTVANHTYAFPLPEDVLAHLPLLRDTVPARFAVLVMLFIAMAVAVGLDRLAASLQRHHYVLGPTALACAAAVIVIPLIPKTPLATKPLPWSGALISAIKDNVPRNATVLSYPYPSPPWSQAMLWQAESGMRFRLMGGYANVEANGVGQYWPPLLAPPDVQEYLSKEEAGRHSHYQESASTETPTAALCQYVKKFAVDNVILWTHAPNAAAVQEYFTAALGPSTFENAELVVWSHAMQSVRNNRSCVAN